MNAEEVHKCNIWRVLGVGECNGCPQHLVCWPEDKKSEPKTALPPCGWR